MKNSVKTGYNYVMTFKRKAYNQFLEWKNNSQGKTALMVEGARRVGKSTLVTEFVQKEYEDFLFLDFAKEDDDVKENFKQNIGKLDVFFRTLFLAKGKELKPNRNTVIVFDEVQLFPLARQAIKYLVADGRYDYIETGSLISIKKNKEKILIPSEEFKIKMYPMDFEEFLWAVGDEQLMPFIRMCFEKKQKLGPLHRKAMSHFRHYMIVGGMPQAVAEYVETNDFMKVDMVKRNILSLYKADIEKYAVGNEMKVKAIFDEIPSALSRHEKKFRLASISDKARYREYESSFFWLAESRVVNICYNSTAPDIGLRMNEERTTLKCYMADTGLLISHAFNLKTIMGNELYLKLALGKLEVNEGMLVENVVAQMLKASGHELFFYSNNSKNSAEDRMEIDFLVSKPVITNRHNISPIEVKSSNSYTITSLNKLRTKFAQMLAESYVLHPADVEVKDGVVYLPLFMASLL